MFGATTLIMAISARAALLPTLSIMSAAFKVSSRACSISMRDSAIQCLFTLCSAMVLPKATRDMARWHMDFERPLGDADQPHAVVDAAGPEPALRDLEAAALAEQHVGNRHAHVLELDFGVAVRRIVIAEHRERAQHLHARRIHRHDDHALALIRLARPDWSGP